MREERNAVRTDGILKKTFRIEKEYFDFMQDNLEKADVRSVNAFVNRALAFYLGYVKTGSSGAYLQGALSSMIGAKLDLSESRIKDVLFKLAVEIAMQNRILARMMRITEKEIRDVRLASEEEVRRIFR